MEYRWTNADSNGPSGHLSSPFPARENLHENPIRPKFRPAVGRLCPAASLHVQALFSLGLVALILGYVTRNRFRKHEWSLGVAHASWQINTVWLSLLLGVLVIIVLIAICGWMGSDPMLETKLDAITNSDLAPQEMLRALWAIPGTKAIVGTIITFTLLCLIWPLKRILQGLLALRSGIEPVEGQGWLALALAVAIQLLLMLLSVLL